MSKLNVLNISDLKIQNDNHFNKIVLVPLTEKIGVEVNITPTPELLSEIVQEYGEVVAKEKNLDLTKATQKTITYFVIGLLLKKVTNIQCEVNSFADYIDLVTQLSNAKYLSPIINAFEQNNYEAILKELQEQISKYAQVLNQTLAKVEKELSQKSKAESHE